MTDGRIDPFDVAALEKSLNDSATRVSTIWVSFLIFSLYLLTAATTVTHRQLFLAEPVKLPVLNIDLPLWGFFFLAPILFVILHAYVLIQVVLLARTAAAYNEAVERAAQRDNLDPRENASLRQRLANTLFAQVFAGSPREREGLLGWFLKAMAWITLAIAPILILLTFQVTFLPYHSHLATWTHRLLILLELTVAFQLWPLVLNAQRDFQRPNLLWRFTETSGHLAGLLWPSADWRRARDGLRRQALPLGASVLFVFLSLSLASFPGEPHVNLFTWHPLNDPQCTRWLHRRLGPFDLELDRLRLPRVDVVDDEKLARFTREASIRNQPAHLSERTRDFRARNFTCADLSSADLRYADLTDANLSGALLRSASLEGASLDRARLRGTQLFLARLQGASLEDAELQAAQLGSAQLQGVSFYRAKLQAAKLNSAQLQGASFWLAELQGASLQRTKAQGAYFEQTQLHGADFSGANLQGAHLNGAQLQGADLSYTNLQGASLSHTRLQGTNLDGTSLDHSLLYSVSIWRARRAVCKNARVEQPDTREWVGSTIGPTGRSVPNEATKEEITRMVASSIASIVDIETRRRISETMERRLSADPAKDDAALAEVWRGCEVESRKITQRDFDARRVALLRDIACAAAEENKPIAQGIIRNWIRPSDFGQDNFDIQLARAMLGEDEKECALAGQFDEETKRLLREVAGPPASPPK